MKPHGVPLLFLYALTLAVVGCGRGGASDSVEALSPTEEEALAAEVRQMVGALVAAMNAHDPATALAFYEDSPKFLYVGCTDLMAGSRLFKGIVGPFLENPEVSFREEILQVRVLDVKTAIVTTRAASHVRDGIFTTRVLVRGEDGGWRIRHEHASWPGCKDPAPPHPGTAGPFPLP